MKNFAEFVKVNKGKLYAHAEEKTLRNKKGDAVIARSDPWFHENEWDNYYEELIARDNSTTRSMVR